MENQGYLGKFLVKDKILSSFSPVFPKNLVKFQSAIIERQVQFSDVSFYQGVINWDKMKTKSPTVIIRAGQNLWVDPQFSRNYSEAKRVGMKRGVYWFYDSRIHPDQQANILINLLKDDLPEMEVFCDWEYNYGGSYFDLQYAVRFMQRVENALHGVKVGMYTGYYFFKDHSSSTKHFVEYDYLKNKPLWLAWYTSNPAYVQIPSPWTKMTHWQWGTPAWGLDWGVESKEIDMNWYNGTVEDFKNNYGGVIVEPPPTGEKMYIYKIPQADIVRAHVTGYSTRKTVAEVAAEFHATCQLGNHSIVINGDGWSGNQSNSIWWSEGKQKNGEQLDWRPRVVFDANDQMTLRFRGRPYYWPNNFSDYNTFSIVRRLVMNGGINPNYVETGEKDARCGFGITANREFVIVGADGNDAVGQGVTITEIGQELINQGVREGGDGDGGGSFTLAYDGVVINNWYNDGQPMRPVINHLCLEIKGTEPPPTGDNIPFILDVDGYKPYSGVLEPDA